MDNKIDWDLVEPVDAHLNNIPEKDTTGIQEHVYQLMDSITVNPYSWEPA